MALSREAKKAYKKALKTKKKNSKKHWLFIKKGDSAKEVVSKLFTQLAVVVLIGCVGIMGHELWLSISAKNLNSSLKDLYYSYVEKSSDDGKMLSSAKGLLEINPDTIGWVHIEDTNVSMPVVQRKNSKDGNDYYLKTAFDGSYNKAGTVFLDRRNTLSYKERSDNLILYGHNQKDKTMFGDLAYYKKGSTNSIEYYKKHPVIQFSSNFTTDTYKIFAYFVTPVEEKHTSDGYIFDYQNYLKLSDRDRYDDFIKNIMLRSQIITDVDLKYGDEFLTLSTCSNEFEPSRFVVFARKVRKDESPEVDTSKAYVNGSAKEPEWSVIYK